MISIIVPIYNVSSYLDACLKSIYGQTYKDFEVLCIDDGSTDNSAEIVRKYIDLDKRFRLYQQSNSGVSVARNLGLRYACGEFICFVDSDDIIAPDYLRVLYDLSQKGYFPICSYTQKISQLGRPSKQTSILSARDLITKVIDESINHPNLWAMMFKSEIINIHNIGFYPGCVRKEDTEFYIKYLVHEFSDVVITDFKGYFYRDNPNSAMHITNKNAFTSFGASERIKRYLIDNGIQMSYNKMLYASIQGYCVGLALGKNKELYEELHKLYSVKEVMISLLKHPRMLRRIVAFVYLLLGKSLFYNSLTLIGK